MKNNDDTKETDIFGRSVITVRSPASKRARASNSPEHKMDDESAMDDEEWYEIETQQEQSGKENDAVLLENALKDLKSIATREKPEEPDRIAATTSLLTIHEVLHRIHMRFHGVQIEKQKLIQQVLKLKASIEKNRVEHQLQLSNKEIHQQNETHQLPQPQEPRPQQIPQAQQQQQQPPKIQRQPRQRTPQVSRPTYSELVKTYGELKQNTQTTTEPAEIWKSPTKHPQQQNILYIETHEGTEIEPKWVELKKKIKAQDINGTIKNIVKVRDNKLILQTHNEAQKDKIKRAIQDDETILYKDEDLKKPVVQICGVQIDMNDSEFKDSLISENEDLVNAFGDDVLREEIRVVHKKKCRIPTKRNWFIETTPKIARYLLKEGKIILNLTKLYVVERIEVTMCFRCCTYGHVIKYCKEKEVCHKCGGKHGSSSCINELNCINCRRMRVSPRNHSAKDQKCPCYQKKLEQQRQRIDYGTE